jgi:tetratricopeptide (TPR) repeat protein
MSHLSPLDHAESATGARQELELAVELEAAGSLDEALKAYHRAVAMNPEDAAAQYRRALLLLRMHRPGEAAWSLAAAARLAPDALAVRAELARSLLHQHRDRDALQVLVELVRTAPQAVLVQARVLQEAGRLHAAEAILRTIIREDADRFPALVTLARCLLAQGRDLEAATAYDEAVACEPAGLCDADATQWLLALARLQQQL